MKGILNPQYPSSWWMVGFSDEVRVGELVPTRLLERDVILWRDRSGALICQSAICPHLGANIGYSGEIVDGNSVVCPFHGYRYDTSGDLCERPGDTTRPTSRLCLTTYPVEEWAGQIFIWNGPERPDHDIIEELDTRIGNLTGTTNPQEELTVYRHGFYLPFPAKWFIENSPDACHFARVHNLGGWAEFEMLEESDWMMRFRFRIQEPHSLWAKLRREFARGALLKAPVTSATGDVEMTVLGAGVHIPKILGGDGPVTGPLSRAARYVENSGCGLICWTPVNADTHVFYFMFVLPRMRIPVLRPVVEALLSSLIIRRDWGGAEQDLAVMLHRQEGTSPPYGRLDRGLVRFRRLWDDRILDRSNPAGDGVRNNGARAGIRWEEQQPQGAPEGPGEVIPVTVRP